MASVDRRWLPPALIACAGVASIAASRSVPPVSSVDFGGLFPWPTPPSRQAPSWLALWLLPAVALLLWIGFRLARTIAAQRVGRRLFPTAPEEVTIASQFDRFDKSYETIVLAVVLLVTGFHAGLLAAALHANATAARIIPIALGGSLMLLGNVMPRLRPNWVAGLRSERLLADPQSWRRANRTFGTAIVASGLLTLLAGIVAPSYGLLVGIAGVLVSCCIALIAEGGQGKGTPRAGTVVVCLVATLGAHGQRAPSSSCCLSRVVAHREVRFSGERPERSLEVGLEISGILETDR